MKLELKHLAPYLPYGLRIMSKYRTATLTPAVYKGKFVNIDHVLDERNFIEGKVSPFYPLLHPISRLTEPILPEGKIPLVELAKTFSNPEFVWKVNTQDYSIECDTLGVWFGSTGKITIQHKCSGDTTTPSNQLEIYMKLFEWHFDVFGLIEQGLAIEKPII